MSVASIRSAGCLPCSPGSHTAAVTPLDRLRTAGKRITDPVESLAQGVAERAVDLIVHAVDVNALLQRVDMNALLHRIDIDEFLKKVDVQALAERVDVGSLLRRADIDEVLRRIDIGALLERVDVNGLVERIDLDALIEQTDIGAIIARSSGGIASDALDAARSQAVGLDQLADRGVRRLLRRGGHRPGAAPPAVGPL
jgi:hypothetical protein